MNEYLFRLINDLGKEYTLFNPIVVFIAEYMVIILAIAVFTFWLTRVNKNRIMVICGIFTFVIAEIFGKIAGKIHSNHQPFAELSNVNQLIEKAVDNSFPSDHTILFFSFCVTFCLYRGARGFFWVLLAFLVGVSRIWVGVHYPADIMAGAIISICTAIIVIRVVPKLSIIQKGLGIYEKAESYILPIKKDNYPG
ncbi:undecaprenyl-diphosphatase [Neobacillus sp. CF12]|uniref:undecaprenyl-diphosphatase n=1 Tax=Neobacillus sp. CF12 TaxID=3055864 RepID=UPI0025A061B5|nr:undecaprenyl-diphosphatase [Neobacillus sp. CF12]MDM5331705.1 undecaprenyl-diphosphatase [Neobacillus sp. CF12]